MSSRSLDSVPLQQPVVLRPDSQAHSVAPSAGARQAFQSSLNRAAENNTSDRMRVHHAPASKYAGAQTATQVKNPDNPPLSLEQGANDFASEDLAEPEDSNTDSRQESSQPVTTNLDSPERFENGSMASTTHRLQQQAFIDNAGVAESACGHALSADAITGQLTCDTLAGMLDRVSAVEQLSGFHSFELVDSALGLKSVQISANGAAGWTVRLLTDRASRDQLRRQGGELHTALSERGYRVASVSVAGVNDAEGQST